MPYDKRAAIKRRNVIAQRVEFEQSRSAGHGANPVASLGKSLMGDYDYYVKPVVRDISEGGRQWAEGGKKLWSNITSGVAKIKKFTK